MSNEFRIVYLCDGLLLMLGLFERQKKAQVKSALFDEDFNAGLRHGTPPFWEQACSDSELQSIPAL